MQNLAMTEGGKAEVEADPDLPGLLVWLLRYAEESELLAGLAGAFALLREATRCLAQVCGSRLPPNHVAMILGITCRRYTTTREAYVMRSLTLRAIAVM